jgi:uncharacterized protein (TIGR02147 family)
MNLSVFDFNDDYRDYLGAVLGFRSKEGERGRKLKLAHALGCQPGFLSQVLGKHAHFNLEHGERIALFLNFVSLERHYFLLLLQKTRAGTPTLKEYFGQQLLEIHEKREQLKHRFTEHKALGIEAQSQYYSSWAYGAIRVALTIPHLRTKEAIAQRLPELAPQRIAEILNFLLENNLAQQQKGEFLPTEIRTHLGNDSMMIRKHHSNWRVKALSNMDQERKENLHYSSVVSLSLEDAKRIKEISSRYLEEVKKIVRDSPAEDLFSLNLDLFGL